MCYTIEAKEEYAKILDIPMVCDFLDVSHEELPGLHTQREINFEIELIPGTQPISKVPH